MMKKILLIIWSLTLISITLYFWGLFAPLYKSERFVFWVKEVSLWGTIVELWQMKEYYLSILIFSFTLLFPVSKYMIIVLSLVKKRLLMRDALIAEIGRWSMIDVFIVALLLISFKFDSGIISIKIMIGLVLFSIAIMLSMVVVYLLRCYFRNTEKSCE